MSDELMTSVPVTHLNLCDFDIGKVTQAETCRATH